MPDKTEPSLFSLRRWDEFIGVLALLAIVGSILWGVVSRYILPTPAAWSYEVATIAFAYLVFFGAVAGVRLGSHAAIDVLVDAFPIGWQRVIAWFNYLLLAGLFLLMTVLFAQQAWLSHGVHTVALNLPRSLYYAPLAVACLGMFVQHLVTERPRRDGPLHRHADTII